ncbi:MAG: hypothetical protein RBS49_01225 [Sphaerochaeta sp.]|jgi:hypothetical protein|nr:hypothetical protein [Sphaerochaeta sp.]MDX9914483.1 hypothetical protein [Sphaerochaeta sp.]
MKHISIALLVFVLVLTSCATSQRPQALPFSIGERATAMVATLSVGREELAQSGYRSGDWVRLEIDGIALRALLADEPHRLFTTLVASEHTSRLYLPDAIEAGKDGILRLSPPDDRQHTSSVSLSGSFIFTF